MSNIEACMSSDRMDWGTPDYVFDKLDEEFKFTCDVCASDDNTKCDSYYTEEDDCLTKDWSGTCWMNPPYGRMLPKFIQKAYEQSLRGVTTVCLIPSRTDTKYWHNYCMKADEIRLVKGRITFVGAPASAPFPSAIIIFRPNAELKITACTFDKKWKRE